jgi:thiamine-phosphate pyrophosphorylase
MLQQLARIVDANQNRVREGLRVAEEVARFVLEDAPLQRALKQLRHQVVLAEKQLPADAIASREIATDPGQEPPASLEAPRATLAELAQANLRRASEGLRVLEECTKSELATLSGEYRRMRFVCYGLEKELLAALRQPGPERPEAERPECKGSYKA